MYNWSTDTKELEKNPDKYKIWGLEQLINFGLGGKKLKSGDVKKYWKKLKLDPKRRKVLKFWLW